MKITPSLLLLAALSPAVLLLSGCGKKASVAQTAQASKVAVKEAATDVKKVAVDSWDNIKDYTFERRAEFADSLDRMGNACDADFAAMNAKLKGLPDDTAQARNAAVKDYNSATTAFKVQMTALRASTADTWGATKEKTSEAWQKVQSTFAAIKTSAKS